MDLENEIIPIAQPGPSTRTGLINEGFSFLPNLANIPIEQFFQDCPLNDETDEDNSVSNQLENEQMNQVVVEKPVIGPRSAHENPPRGSLLSTIISFLIDTIQKCHFLCCRTCGRKRRRPNPFQISLRDIIEDGNSRYIWTVQEFVESKVAGEQIMINEKNFPSYVEADNYMESYKEIVAITGGTLPHFRVFRTNNEDGEEENKNEEDAGMANENYNQARCSGVPPSVVDTTDPNLDDEWVIGIEESD